MSRRYVEVALPPPLARQFTYGVPEEVDSLLPGALVLVPVSQRLLTGVATRVNISLEHGLNPSKIRDIVQVLDDSLLSDEIVDLCRWLAEYYMAPLGSALVAALPPGVRLSSKRSVSLTQIVQVKDGGVVDAPEWEQLGGEERALIEELARSESLKVSTLQHRLGRKGLEKRLTGLRRRGLIDIAPILEDRRTRAVSETHVYVVDSQKGEAALPVLEKRARRQADCLRYLLEQGGCARPALVRAGFSAAVIKGLEERGLVESELRERVRDPLAHIEQGEAAEFSPTVDQERVITALGESLRARAFHGALLHGVTGSGKTLVYTHLVRSALEQGRSAIVLVPEIALAWQMVRRFKQHFGDEVAVLHSQLSAGERYDTWKRLRRGEQRIVIGARSAVLAPLPDLGLLIVDEEHDSSYKQEDLESAYPLSYSARDLALMRGQRQRALVVLGSATPSLESYANVEQGKYTLYSLPSRVDDRPLPAVHVVDMKREPFQRKQRAIFSKMLRLKMEACFERGEQVVLLQNRRGFAPFISCGSCGESVQCASCRVSLTYHRSREGARSCCHYCDFSAPVPPVCPSCGAAELRFEGVGTQKVEEALVEQFPSVSVIRMDVDTTGWKGAHDELVERFRRREADVLLGTQMVAKGLDFPEVTLVGVISADTGMHMPDFRASERSFQLLTQVAGRSGRGEQPGEVVVQTRLPDDPVLLTAAEQDYVAFAERELNERREAGFPPFGRLLVLRWRGEGEEAVEHVARGCSDRLMRSLDSSIALLGPSPAPLARLRGAYRWQALLRAESARVLRDTARDAWDEMSQLAQRHGVIFTVNVDPLTMM
ncbi:MAG: primosomal protein N' [Candidatus Latescibacterota bacterium]|nr:primosomal protein N' [Candidatus Latescibacterota bacterium]MEE2729116.1 primosomal protein N' [Candidatus Latescibacterota bacterium]